MLPGLVSFLLCQGFQGKGTCPDIGYQEHRKRRSRNMKLTASVRLFVAIATLQISSAHGADTSCDCTIFPFAPDPPCVDSCICKNMAIASADDLRNVFGIPADLANVIAKITPSDRPRRLEDYRYLLLGYLFARTPKPGFEPVVASQRFEQRVRL